MIKKKNVCQADIWLQPISEIKQEMNKDYVKEIANKNPLMASVELPMRLVSLQAIRLMGHKVKLRIDDNVITDNVITQDGKEFEGVELGKLTNLVALLGELSDASMKYKVTSGDKGEYILAELVKSSGNELYENDKKSEVELVEIVKTNK